MLGGSYSRLNSGSDKNNILSIPPKTDSIKDWIEHRRHNAVSNMVGASMMLGMMLARLQDATSLSRRHQPAVSPLRVPPSVNLIGLTQEQKRKPSVLRRIKAKARATSQHRWNDCRVVAMPIRATQESVLIRMMKLVWPTDELSKNRRILVEIAIFPPMKNTGNEIRREE
jgi:hypothetical protein